MNSNVRPRPPLLRALGLSDPPETVEISGTTCQRVETFKHDSWAATARYVGNGLDVVCKFNRIQSIFGIPMRWLGRRLALREATALQRLAGIPGIPTECGAICVAGKKLDNAVGHLFIEGEPLGEHRPPDQFFARLIETLKAVHARQVAYVDLHKRENVLVGRDGQPYLLDFQVCFGLWSTASSRWWICRSLLKTLQQTDLFCMSKHLMGQRPDEWPALADQLVNTPPWWIRLHRRIATPLRKLRRGFLSRLRVRDKSGRAESETFTEIALRNPPKKAA